MSAIWPISLWTNQVRRKPPSPLQGPPSATDANSLFHEGGTSLVIHAKADDLKSDPSGNSGDRVACGVIEK